MELSEGYINHPVVRKRVALKEGSEEKEILPTSRSWIKSCQSWDRLFVYKWKDSSQYWSCCDGFILLYPYKEGQQEASKKDNFTFFLKSQS